MGPAVRFENITKTFPGVTANDDISFDIERGSVHSILGENGAGKTTLMNILYGLYRPDSGRILVNGEPKSFDSPRDAIDSGIGMIHQHFMLVDTMSVAKNVVLGYEPREFFDLFTDETSAIAATEELSSRYGFDVDPTDKMADVSVGVQQRVEILKSLYRGADILILDEPTAVLTPQEVSHLFDVFEDLVREDKTIIFITHKIGEALSVADRITVLRDGRTVDTVESAETDEQSLAELMVGREVILDIDRPPARLGDPLLEVSSLSTADETKRGAVHGVDMELHEGEIFGVVGVDGNGQRALVEAIVGARSIESGMVRYAGEDITDKTRVDRKLPGFSYIPSDRQGEGLVMDFTMVENAILGEQHTDRFSRGNWVDWEAARRYTQEILEEYDVRPRKPDATAKSYSGGNQQKFVVGRELLSEPDVVVASNPTRGVDIGSVEFIHDRLMNMRAEGKGVLLVSSKLDEVRKLADRVAVMYEGVFEDVVDPEQTTEQEFGLLMAGEHPSGQGMDAGAGDDGGMHS